MVCWQALSTARMRWQQALRRNDELQQKVQQAQSEGARHRQDARAMRERLSQVEQQLERSQQESTGLQHQALDVRNKVQVGRGAAADADGTGDRAPARADLENEELAWQLAQARGSIEDLSQQRAALEELVHDLKRRATADEQQARRETAALGDSDARVFGLQASGMQEKSPIFPIKEPYITKRETY